MEEKKSLGWQKISWSAIFAGALAGFAINFLLNLLALSIGISVFSALPNGAWAFSILGFSAFGLISIVTMSITGWIAGRLTPPLFIKRIWGALIGFIAWSLLLILTIVIITNMIQFTAFHSNFTSHPNLVAIKISNLPTMTETKTLNKSVVDLNIEKTTKEITLNTYVTFFLFLLGAIASSIGGWHGYARSKTQPWHKKT